MKLKINPLYSVLIALFLHTVHVKAQDAQIRFAYVGDQNHSAFLGAQQGIAEANLQGRFLGQSYTLDIVAPAEVTTHDFKDTIAVLASTDLAAFQKLNQHLPDMPVFNLTLDNNELRENCQPNALHVIPSARMKKDAMEQWRSQHPESTAVAQAWHGDFLKFAARDLNKRFKKAHGQAMDDFSWSGWAAVKMTSDSVARENIRDASAMLKYLKSDLSFDGQKGASMDFRETGQLRQIILLVENDKIVAEAPVRGVAKPPTVDSLGRLTCAQPGN